MSNLISFTPLMRQTIGFDKFSDLFDQILNESEDRFEAYPPYNIEKTGEDGYCITLAVAGFSDADIDVTIENDRLSVRGQIRSDEKKGDGVTYLHRGIATRSFERIFRLADHIKVENASMENGLLSISLVREVPEEKKPRMIPINGKSVGLLTGKKSKLKS